MQSRSVSRRTVIMWIITLLIAGGALYAACRGVDWHMLAHTVQTAQWTLLLLAGFIAAFTIGLRGLRWRVLIISQPPAPLLTVCWACAIGYLGNYYLPARAGEIIRSVVLGRRLQLSTSYVLATALTERLLDVVALAIIATLALLTQHTLPNWLRAATPVMGLVALVSIICLILTARSQQLVLGLLARLPLPEGLRGRLGSMVTQFILGLRSIHQPARAGLFSLLTALIWVGDGVGVIVGARALGIGITLSQGMLLNAALGLASVVPSTPGGVGVFQFTAVSILTPFGVAKSSALAYILISQMISYTVITLLGFLGLWQLGLSFGSATRLSPTDTPTEDVQPVDASVASAPALHTVAPADIDT